MDAAHHAGDLGSGILTPTALIDSDVGVQGGFAPSCLFPKRAVAVDSFGG